MQQQHPDIKGLPNEAGTACHISSAIVLLCYAVPPIRQVLTHIAATTTPTASVSPLIRELGRVFFQLSSYSPPRNNQDDDDDDDDDDTVVVVDPTALYQTLSQRLGMEARSLGDAVTALTKLIHELATRKQDNGYAMDAIVANVVEAALGTGKISTHIQATFNKSVRRIKNSTSDHHKLKTMPVPLTLSSFKGKNDGNSLSCLEDCLENYLSPVIVEGYQWNEGIYLQEQITTTATSSTCDGQVTDDDSSVNCWVTTKRNQIESIPKWWMLYLDRFEYRCGMVQPRNQPIQIPMTLLLDPSTFGCQDASSNNLQYNLVGAILHVCALDRGNNDDANGEEESGHYVVLVPSSLDPNVSLEEEDDEVSWTMIDDEKVSVLNQAKAMELMAGSLFQCDDDDTTCEMRAIVLVYQSHDAMEMLQPLVEQAQSDLTRQQELDHAVAQALIGRRLRVKWARNKFYAGRIAHYDAANGTHTVQYDDGDVRTYTLCEKTLEWLD